MKTDFEYYERQVEQFGCTTKRISKGTRLAEGEAIRVTLPTGHQMELYHDIQQVGKADRYLKSASLVRMTFFPHPREVLCGGKEKMNYLTPLEVKIKKFAQLGVDKLYVIKFDQAFAAFPKGLYRKICNGIGRKTCGSRF